MGGSRLPIPDAEASPRDVRFIGAVAGCYALSGRGSASAAGVEIFACRLCSISTRMGVVVAPVVGRAGDGVSAHFDAFGILRGTIARRVESGFAFAIDCSEEERARLAAKIGWYKRHVLQQLPDRREHRRWAPRDPRSTIIFADGAQVACFVIDVSRSGVAVSAEVTPQIGTPLAVGRIVGRVVRYLEVGFAEQFIELQEIETVEGLLLLR